MISYMEIDTLERLKQYEAQLEKVKKAAKDLENLGQDNSKLLEIIPELEEKIRAYKELAQNELPGGLYKLRESYQLERGK